MRTVRSLLCRWNLFFWQCLTFYQKRETITEKTQVRSIDQKGKLCFNGKMLWHKYAVTPLTLPSIFPSGTEELRRAWILTPDTVPSTQPKARPKPYLRSSVEFSRGIPKLSPGSAWARTYTHTHRQRTLQQLLSSSLKSVFAVRP